MSLNLICLTEFLAEPLHTVDESLDLLVWMVENAGVPDPSSEADFDKVGAEGFLPTPGGIPRAVKTQSKFGDLAAAELGIFRRKLDEDVPVDLCVEIRSSETINHH